jgi:hypothetical protein
MDSSRARPEEKRENETNKIGEKQQTYKNDTRRSVQSDSSACCNGAEDGCATKQKAVQKY